MRSHAEAVSTFGYGLLVRLYLLPDPILSLFLVIVPVNIYLAGAIENRIAVSFPK
jgi:hypothetical protein